jgi:hypothetical protein
LQYLASKKNFEKIKKILDNIAKENKTKLDDTTWKSFLAKV